jgi:hypothetical protein
LGRRIPVGTGRIRKPEEIAADNAEEAAVEANLASNE